MLSKILLPLVESELSESTIPCALDFAARGTTETLLVEVAPLPLAGAEVEQQQLEQCRLYLQRQSARWGAHPVTYHTPVGRPDEEICRLAFDEGCDLILMASHGRDHFSRWLLGSVAEGVLRQARCPVLLLRPPAAPHSLFQKILVPTDGSDVSLAFLPNLPNFLAPGGTITLLLSTGTSLSRPIGGLEAHFQLTENRLRQLQWNGEPYPLVVLKADPVHDILSWSQANSCDLIAMSTHGRGGFRRFWLGSVTEKVARHAHCPVLVYPHFRPVDEV